MNISTNGKSNGKGRGVTQREFVAELDVRWRSDRRWQGITRSYTPEDVYRLRGTLPIQHTLAAHGAARLWKLMREEPYVAVLSAVTGNQAVQEVRAGLKAIYISGWQVAADRSEERRVGKECRGRWEGDQ